MRVLGQVANTYLVAESDDGILLIDQHAADERVNYERLQDRLDSPATQALADPVEVELTAREAELFPAFADALADLGFRAERTGDRSVTVTAVPGVFSDVVDPERLRDVLGEFLEGDAETSVDATVEDLLADLACYPSITGNTSLTEGSARALLTALDDCENPYACPHGRPVVIEIDHDEIEDRFERDYPGHAG
jgi:DNA mismatch repair protein MutL